MYCLVSVIACLPGKIKPLRFMLGTDPNMTLYNRLCCAVGRKNSMEKCIVFHLHVIIPPYEMSMRITPKQKYMGLTRAFSYKVP